MQLTPHPNWREALHERLASTPGGSPLTGSARTVTSVTHTRAAGPMIAAETDPWLQHPDGTVVALAPLIEALRTGADCECEGTGLFAPASNGPTNEGIECCDTCQIHAGDLEAAAYLAAKAGPDVTIWFESAAVPQQQILTLDDFEETYNPVDSPSQETHWSYPETTDAINSGPFSTEQVWSVVNGDFGITYLPGFHVVNVDGYVLTEKPWPHRGIEMFDPWDPQCGNCREFLDEENAEDDSLCEECTGAEHQKERT